MKNPDWSDVPFLIANLNGKEVGLYAPTYIEAKGPGKWSLRWLIPVSKQTQLNGIRLDWGGQTWTDGRVTATAAPGTEIWINWEVEME